MTMDQLATMSPVDAAWNAVYFLEPAIWWVKAICALLVAVFFVILPPLGARGPDGHLRLTWSQACAMASRVGAMGGAFLIFLSKATPINAFGPLGDLIFWPCFAINFACLIWCSRRAIMGWMRQNRSPEVAVVRALIAGVSTGRKESG